MFAFIIAYSIFIMGYFAEMEIEIIRMAGKVNEIKFISPSYGNFPFKEPYTPNNSGNREKLVNRLVSLMSGRALFNSKPLPDTPEKRAEKTLGLMNLLSQRYPFSGFVFSGKEGWGSRSERKLITFSDVGEVRQWINDVESIEVPLLGTWSLNLNIVSNDLKVLDQKEQGFRKWIETTQNKMPVRKIDRMRILRPENKSPLLLYDDFFKNLIEASRLAKSTRFEIDRLDRLRSNYPSHCLLIVFTIFTFFTFISGVIGPMLLPNIKRIFLTCIPILFYTFIMVYIMFRLFNQ